MSEGEEEEDWEEEEEEVEVEPEEHAIPCFGCAHKYGSPDCAECPSYDGSASDFEDEEGEVEEE